MKTRSRIQLVLILGVSSVIAYYHFGMIDVHTPIHSVHYRLNYLPILLAAVWFGRWGGAISAGLVTAVYLPNVVWGHGHDPYINMNVYLEFVLYNVVGWVVGELVTRRIQDQKKLEESKRLAALGEVAAGIAHEIRNPAQTIRGAIDFVLKKSKEESVTGILRTAREEVDRLDSFAKNFLSLASNPVPRKVSTNISALCRDIGARVTLAKGENIPEITYDELENLPEVQCDPEQIGQVIRNLMENAVEAIAKTDRIKISGILLTNTVVISVEDSGAGVPKDLQEKIFEPFCSKKSGGTGLGLAISRRIMEAHQGGIICEKSSLNGAAFHLTLPRQT